MLDEQKKRDILSLLRRIDTIYRSKPRPDSDLIEVAKEWYKYIGFCDIKQLDDALTIYVREDSGSTRYPPKPGELLKIYKDMRKSQEDNKSWDTEGLCLLCYGGGGAIVTLPEDKDYGSLGIKCPCRIPGELQALKQGSKLTRKLSQKNRNGDKFYWCKLHFWLENDRLTGVLEMPQKKEIQEIQKPELVQESFTPVFSAESEPWVEDLPDDWLPF